QLLHRACRDQGDDDATPGRNAGVDLHFEQLALALAATGVSAPARRDRPRQRVSTMTQRASSNPGMMRSCEAATRQPRGMAATSSRGHLPFIARTWLCGPVTGATLSNMSGNGANARATIVSN